YYADSCYTNEFDLDKWTAYNRDGGTNAGNSNNICLGKKIVASNLGGALAYVGYSRTGLLGSSQELSFWRSLSREGGNRPGKMLDYAREIGLSRVGKWNLYVLNLIGDPEMPIYTEPPKLFSVSMCSHLYGQEQLTIKVFHKGLPYEDANVIVSQISSSNPLEKRYFTLQEYNKGFYVFDTANASNGEINVVVTANNFIPYTATVQKANTPVSSGKFITGGFVYDLSRRSDTSFYAASDDGNIYAVNRNMEQLWKTFYEKPVIDTDVKSDGTVLLGLSAAISNNLVLLDSNGHSLSSWSMPRGCPVMCVALSERMNYSYAGLVSKGVHCYNNSDSRLVWSRENIGTCYFMHILSTGDVLAVCDTKLYKLAVANGTNNWTPYSIGDRDIFQPCSFLVDGNLAYIGTRNHELHTVDITTGTIVRNRDRLPAAVTALAVMNNVLYAAMGDGTLISIEANGTENWRVDLGNRIDSIAVRNNTLYIGCWRSVIALDSNHNIIWNRETTGTVISLRIIGRTLYAGSRDGLVYSIEI
ncbi:MAG: PQQ-binding-like beta-propeller repeat protein, partial [Oscillospiraceae bacterium]